MTTNEVREKYLKFFEKRGHKIIPPAPLVLENDPTTLFTSSGMQPLVPNLLGEPHPEGKRVTDSQPSIRVQDIEEVGDNRHTTFFEMLGNWSFGDYFKKEQLQWIWEFLTRELKLSEEKLYVTIFEGNEDVPRDDESYKIWKSLGLQDDHISEYDIKKNWWSRAGTPSEMPIGEPGGPTSEIFFEFDNVKHDKKFGEKCHPNCDCGRFLEIGNSVFMVYRKTKDGLEELENKNVDFGGGLERLVAATNNNPDILQIDVFANAISDIEKLVNKKYENENMPAMRIVADHLRASCFLIANGVEPSNKLQGYVLRRLIRRAVFRLRSLGFDIKEGAISTFAKSFKEDYATISENWPRIKDLLNIEALKFAKSLDNGLKKLKSAISKGQEIDGKFAFDLYQTDGFPLELTLEILSGEGMKFNEDDKERFEEEFKNHQDKSRSASAGVFKGGLADHSIEVTRLHTAHHLVLAALQKIVDPSIAQKGSNINAERMRMDFNFGRKLTPEEIKRVEDLVNKKIDENLVVTKKIMPKGEAEKLGAQMEFGKKYPDNVSIYFIGPEDQPFSLEFCGGPHVSKLSELHGHVRITKEESAGASVRRIYASIE